MATSSTQVYSPHQQMPNLKKQSAQSLSNVIKNQVSQMHPASVRPNPGNRAPSTIKSMTLEQMGKMGKSVFNKKQAVVVQEKSVKSAAIAPTPQNLPTATKKQKSKDLSNSVALSKSGVNAQKSDKKERNFVSKMLDKEEKDHEPDTVVADHADSVFSTQHGERAAMDAESSHTSRAGGLQKFRSVLHLNDAHDDDQNDVPPDPEPHESCAYNGADSESQEQLRKLPKRPARPQKPQKQQNEDTYTAPEQSVTYNDTNQESTMTDFQLQHFTPLQQYKKLQLKKASKEKFDISKVNSEQLNNARKILYDFDETRLRRATEALVNGEATLDVRRLQAALFIADINSNINDQHKMMVGSDLSSSLPHYLWLGLWGVLIGCGIALMIIFNFTKVLLNILTYFFYFFIVLEYVLMFAALKTGQYAKKPVIDPENVKKIPPGRISLAIPVGWGIKGLSEDQKAAKRQGKLDVLTNTIDAALKVFEPQDIYIYHNSSDQELPDRVVMECCAGRAVYVPVGIGSKSVSAYYGAMLGSWLGYEFVIVMDDDTRLPLEMGTVLSQPLDCDAYCFAIAAATNDDPATVSGHAKTIIALQDIEYKLSDLSKLVQYNFTASSSVLAPHGAINMWRTDLLTDIMNEHNCIFHGEDYQMGLIMRSKHANMRLGLISSCIVNTVAPACWKDLYYQRLTSWDLAAQQFLWGGFCASQRSAHYMQALFCLPCRVDNIFIRISTLEDVWTVLQDYLRFILLAYHILFSIIYQTLNVIVLVMYLVVLGSQWVIAFSLEYVKFKQRQDLALAKDVRLKAVLLFPIYRFMFSFVRVFALLRFFFKYESVKRNAQPIKHMTLPQPRQLTFAFPGLRNKSSESGNRQMEAGMDFETIQRIVAVTLSQERQVRRNQQFSKFPVSLNEQSEPSRASLMAKTRFPQSQKEYSVMSKQEVSDSIAAQFRRGSQAEISVK